MPTLHRHHHHSVDLNLVFSPLGYAFSPVLLFPPGLDLHKPTQHQQPTIPLIHGLNGKPEVKRFGIAKWPIKDDATGNIVALLAPAYHVPSAEVCLLSPQQYFQHSGGRSLYADKDTCCITTTTGATVNIPYVSNNLSSVHLHTPVDMMANVAPALDNDTDLLSPDNTNLSAP
eukprot:8309731-Ditylum_brightwellii.AAC.1